MLPLVLSAVHICCCVLSGTAVLQCILFGHGIFALCASVLASVEVACRQFFLPPVSVSLFSLAMPPPANARLWAGRGLCTPVDLLGSILLFAYVLASVFATCVCLIFLFRWGISLTCVLVSWHYKPAHSASVVFSIRPCTQKVQSVRGADDVRAQAQSRLFLGTTRPLVVFVSFAKQLSCLPPL